MKLDKPDLTFIAHTKFSC